MQWLAQVDANEAAQFEIDVRTADARLAVEARAEAWAEALAEARLGETKRISGPMGQPHAAAQKKFRSLDTDQRGYISGEELDQMVDWVWRCFEPASAPLREQKRQMFGRGLLADIDGGSSGRLTLEALAPWHVDESCWSTRAATS